MTYDIKDINLAPEGEKKIKWVQKTYACFRNY